MGKKKCKSVKIQDSTHLHLMNIQFDLMSVYGEKYSFDQILEGLVSNPVKRGIALKKIKAMIEAD